MNYIGSKYSLLPFLQEGICKFANPEKHSVFFDIFAGTGIVGQHFKGLGFQIIANDVQYYSYCLNQAYIGLNKEPTFDEIAEGLPKPINLLIPDNVDIVLDYLNNLEGVEGALYHRYCLGGTKGTEHPRQYFTDENGKICDAIRLQLEDWKSSEIISEAEYHYLLAALIEAIDKVANTASVYGAFLKHIKRSAQKRLNLERLKILPSGQKHQVYNCDGTELVDKVSCDILYMDPPYNQRQYCTNYHVLETIAKYDNPELNGVTGLRDYRDQKSSFCSRSTALGSFEKLLQRAKARYVFFSYNNEGLMAEKEIMETMKRYGNAELKTQEYRRFRADVDRENRKYKSNEVTEFLFCLEKNV